MKNEGKKFEEDFIKSLPENVFKIRLKDAGGWAKSNETRFTISNPCDFIILDEKYKSLYMLELKSLKKKSIPYNNMKQIDELTKIQNKYPFIKCMFIINFRDLEKTFLIDVGNLNFIKTLHPNRKSFSYESIEKFGILIPQVKKRVRYKYELEELFI